MLFDADADADVNAAPCSSSSSSSFQQVKPTQATIDLPNLRAIDASDDSDVDFDYSNDENPSYERLLTGATQIERQILRNSRKKKRTGLRVRIQVPKRRVPRQWMELSLLIVGNTLAVIIVLAVVSFDEFFGVDKFRAMEWFADRRETGLMSSDAFDVLVNQMRASSATLLGIRASFRYSKICLTPNLAYIRSKIEKYAHHRRLVASEIRKRHAYFWILASRYQIPLIIAIIAVFCFLVFYAVMSFKTTHEVITSRKRRRQAFAEAIMGAVYTCNILLFIPTAFVIVAFILLFCGAFPCLKTNAADCVESFLGEDLVAGTTVT